MLPILKLIECMGPIFAKSILHWLPVSYLFLFLDLDYNFIYSLPCFSYVVFTYIKSSFLVQLFGFTNSFFNIKL